MSHPWSQMSQAEMDRRKRLLHTFMLLSGIFLVALFAVQVRASVHAREEYVEDKSDHAFKEIVSGAAESLQDVKEATETATELVGKEIENNKRNSRALDKLVDDLEETGATESEESTVNIIDGEVVDAVDEWTFNEQEAEENRDVETQ